MTLTPAQEIEARSAAERILLARPEAGRVVLTRDQAHGLLLAASETLDIDPDSIDRGPYRAPSPLPKNLHAYTHDQEGTLTPLDSLPAAVAATA